VRSGVFIGCAYKGQEKTNNGVNARFCFLSGTGNGHFAFFKKIFFQTIKPNGMQMLLNRQKGKESPKKERRPPK